MNIILYGLGSGVEQIKRVLKEEHRIIAYSDSFSCIKEYMGNPFVKPAEIKKMDYDFIIITIRNRKKAYSICEWLIEEYDINAGKIIPYFCCVDMELYKAKLLHQKEAVEGLIIGNSMSQYGVIEDVFPNSFLNLSCRSQDIYTSSFILEKIITEYSNKIENLKYLIFDLYDYNGFNIDLSMSNGYLDYISCGGVYHEHNFSRNMNDRRSLSEALFEDKYMVREEKYGEIYNRLFLEHVLILPENKNDNRFYHIEAQASLDAKKFIGPTVKKRFGRTIKENIAILEHIVKELKYYKPHLKMKIGLMQ